VVVNFTSTEPAFTLCGMSESTASTPLLLANTQPAQSQEPPKPPADAAAQEPPKPPADAAAQEPPKPPADSPPPDSNMALLMALLQLVQGLAASPSVQALFEAQAKRFSADANLNAGKASSEAELNKLREILAHERITDNQKSQWMFNIQRDKMVFRLMGLWTCAAVVLVVAAVYAIYAKVIDSQSALTLGVLITGAMGVVTSRVSNRPPPTQPPT
jgi:hypothetical protein